ncbi:MAG: phosphodiester glycosidase family protein [Nannocystaceae bacterium]|nr:phosphodiester glycosidase family protein [Nannocystaceae bacterium]
MRRGAATWGIVACGVGLVLAAWPRAAAAADEWSEPLPGVRLLRRSTGAPLRIFAAQIDLCADGISLRATKSDERQRTVSSFAGLVDAQLATNGDFFSYADYSTSGLAVGAGEPWADTADGNGSGTVAFGHGRAEILPPAVVLDAPAPWMREVVSGRRPLVEAGAPYPADEGDLCTTRHPRTAAGLSQDRRTLILAVVDGRSDISIGMRCTELAELMLELGAWDASNLDGGGSSTMWIEGEGVVNVPSDGAQRVVGNHLGVLARGNGEPGSCDRSWEESVLLASAHDAGTTTDLDADGRADVCARGADGVVCRLALDGFATEVAGPAWTDAAGWNAPERFGSLRSGDIDGDGRADLCGRDAAGLHCVRSASAPLADPLDVAILRDEDGYAAPAAAASLRLADVDGDGRDDVCARNTAALSCHRASDDGFEATPWTIDALGDDDGFDAPSQHGTIRLGDLDADGRADVCARTAAGMRCWLATAGGFGEPIDGPAWSDAAGWDRVEAWSTIALVDVDGDRRRDLCGRSPEGVRCALSLGESFGDEILGPAWSDDSGWWDYANASTLRWGDLDGDGDTDLCARANAGIRCAPWTGDGFGEAFAGPALADDSGWGSIRFFSTLRLADVDGDGRDDLCARAAAGMRCWISQGDAFAEDALVGPAWSDDAGWDVASAWATVAVQSPAPRCYVQERCDDGRDDDCDGAIDEGCDGGGSSSGGSETGGGEVDETTGAASHGGDGSSDGALPDTFGESDADGSCACTAAPVGDAAPWWLLLPLLRTRSRPAPARARGRCRAWPRRPRWCPWSRPTGGSSRPAA